MCLLCHRRMLSLVVNLLRNTEIISFIDLYVQILSDLYDRFSERLSNLNLIWLQQARFSEAVHEKGAPLQDFWGFIDGTARPIARPVYNQRIMHSGHKRIHCLKSQVNSLFIQSSLI
jgi:hypothetical protein